METEKPSRTKAKSSKSKNKKKEKEGTKCAFFSELARKWARLNRERDEDEDNFIVRTIIDNVMSALPVKYYRTAKKESLKQIEMQKIAPELLPNDTVEVPKSLIEISNPELIPLKEPSPVPSPRGFVIPRMPLISSEVFKTPVPKKKKKMTLDASMNTESEESTADELVKHVHTLRKISLIAEEFNKKTARNLKEIVDSVQEDLIKKIQEMRTQEGKSATLPRIKVAKAESFFDSGAVKRFAIREACKYKRRSG
ncbi:hypothetical protein EVAR_5754_1 [Eumeta japonica]|uniref:Uncharacterized protein n=1 Tax=Eumeta variegata TaxID=151549 RepID=A0A4C1T7A5_EUMVA|nr:hypothetical protein EVAR_5754_1 [Eumeta japonica]